MRINRHISYLTGLMIILTWTAVLNASTGVTLHVDRTSVTQTDVIKMIIKISGTQSAVTPRIGGLQNFRVESGGTSSNFSMVNGQVSSSIDQTYYLYPNRIGKFTIGPAVVNFNGKNYKSNVVKITVSKHSSDAAQQSSQPVFVTASLSDTRAYVGQSIFYTVKFYYNVAVRNIGIIPSNGQGFSLKQVGKPSEYSSNVKGKKYNVIEIRHVLTTEKTGTFNIPPTIMKMNVLQRKNSRHFSVFDDFFTSSRPHQVQSKGLKLTISPLPQANQPANFTGLVGDFTIHANLNPDKIESNESTTLSLEISGTGNVQLMPDIEFPEMANIKVYADKPEISINETAAGYTGKKIMKWALVPQREGNYDIGPFDLSFFSAKEGQYKTVSTQKMNLIVTPGKEPSRQPQMVSTDQNVIPIKKEVKFFQLDILPVHDQSDALQISSYDQLSLWQRSVMFIFPPFVYLLVVVFFFRKTRMKIEKLTAKKALVQFNKNLSKLQAPKNVAEMLKLFYQFLNQRLQRNGGTLTPDEVQKILTHTGISSEICNETKSMLNQIEAAVYTGQSDHDIEILETSIRELAKKLDKGIKS
jgi:hypothetical protein